MILCMTGLARVVLVMASLVGFNWAVNTQENPVQNNQDRRPNQSAVLQKWQQALNAKEEEKAFRRKNKEDKDPNRKGKAKNVATEEFLPEVKEDRAAKERRKQMQRELLRSMVLILLMSETRENFPVS